VPLVRELQRRRVFRALAGYAVAAFAVLQIIEPVMHGLHWPDAVLSYVVVALAVGFPAVVALAWVFDLRGGRIERTPETAGLTGARLIVLVIAVGAFAATPGLVYYFVFRDRRASVSTAPLSAPSIAALPLVNLTRDPDQEYFADGLAEELLNLLARVPGLHVAGRTSSFAFKGKNEDVRTIGQKLNVATVLEGSVQKAGDRVRIQVQLINAADGYHLWSETYDRKLTDVFAVQDEIAQSVVQALKLKLLPAQASASAQRRTDNVEVYTQYLLGRQFSNRLTLDGFRRAADAYRKALAGEPGFAPAWAGLAQATYWIADWSENGTEIAESRQHALDAAEKAVALGPNLADGYAARGVLRSAMRHDWEGGKADFERALSLSPENPDVQRDFALFVLRPVGRLEDAIVAARRSAALDPLNGRAWGTLGSLLVAAGRLQEAHDALNRSLEVNPDQAFTPYWLGVALLLEGQPVAALAEIQRSTSGVRRLTGVALAQHDLGDARASQRALDEVVARYAESGPYRIAVIYAWRGETDRAFAWLDRACAQRDLGIMLLKTDPLLRGLRGDPRYMALLKKLNLPVD